MEILQTLKKNLSSAADYTVKKTTEVTEAAKLSMEMKSKSSKLNALFTEIGRIAYADLKNGTESREEIAALAAQADTLKAEIAALKSLLAKAQGCVICPACAAKVKDTANYCPTCGTKLPKEEPAAPAEDIPAEEAEPETAEDVTAETEEAAEETPAEDTADKE